MRSKEQIEAMTEDQPQKQDEQSSKVAEIVAWAELGCEQQEKQHISPGERLRPYQFKPGQSGNPNGRPKRDMAAELARAVIEENPDAVYKGMLRTLAKGSAFAFQVVSDRGYGKLKEQIDLNVSGSLAERLEKARKRKASK